MAEPLKNYYGIEVAQRLADDIAQKHPQFNHKKFLHDCRQGYEELELMPRGRHIARTLKQHLPADYSTAVDWLLDSLGPKLTQTENNGMAPFFYLPHTMFVAEYGLEHFEESMRALYELTQRFTAEYSIRPFLERETSRTLQQLEQWVSDDSVHVRRLVSEGTRPRLPWASRLKTFQQNPRPVLPLLEKLRDDPEIYVRRSVANHLNDIGKDHPDLLCQITKSWLRGADENRRWVIQHALRSLIKQGHQQAFQILGYEDASSIKLLELIVTPEQLQTGESASISIHLKNSGKKTSSAIVDFQVWFLKGNGTHQPKTFKLKNIALKPGETVILTKQVSFREMTTRKHYPGLHRVTGLINGHPNGTAEFHLK